VKVVSVMTTDASGGGEFAALEMLEALRAAGHEVVMLSNQPAIGEHTAVTVRTVDLGPKLSGRSWLSLLVRWPSLVNRLRAALEAEYPYDALLVHYKKEQLLAAQLEERLRARLVWAEWGPVPFQMRKGLPRRMYLRACERASHVMAISPGTRDSLREVGVPAEKITVVPNIVRVDQIDFTPVGRQEVRRELGLPDQALVVGCVSRFDRKKRNDVVIDAAIELGRSDVHLVLAGAGEREGALRERAEPLGQRAHFIPTPANRIAAVLSAFDVAVFCPSPTEGAPRAVILAMLAQRPCLATAGEGVVGMIPPGTGEIITPEHDPGALAAALAAYLDDPARRAREGRAARAFAERAYAADVVAEQVIELLGSPRARA
jgi:glycosyltransferase involved in cell wall biosynthesis